MAPSADEPGPIFIGGTGRSGTSVMGSLLDSHPQIVLPAHENKLIVEAGGLKDLVDRLSGRFDMKRRHYAVADFLRWARKLRSFGFRDPALNAQVTALRTDKGMNFQQASEAVARANPAADLSIHAIGQGFGLEHYDGCANRFLRKVCGTVIEDGLVDTEGLIKPFIFPDITGRDALLRECRVFLDELYAEPMRRAQASRWCDDTPSNWLYFDFLHELYPGMRFIHMIRDPRDVVGSYVKQVWAPSDPRVVVAMFKAQFAAYEAIKRHVPSANLKEVRMEDISSHKAETLGGIADFLGVEKRFNGDLFFNERAHSGGYEESLGKPVVQLIETELGGWMREHGYLA
ncbi:sulfotransferase [Phenylobacterium sp.]|uniref:sulfotransferase family protein n=1 Tax=Phenylobacterium sp. TaxID=1871053 RepID=UPI0012250626|nr:sulfotransferase [Phenylobacterium sp.]THD60499.1 MAG: sulfotransferase [Phenylobacterium sp.]